MRGFVLYDDARARTFEPFATTRPLGELRAGAPLVRERWEWALGVGATAFVGAEHLRHFGEFDAPPFLTEAPAVGTVLVNTRALPRGLGGEAARAMAAADAVRIDGQVAAVRIAAPLRAVQLDGLTEGSLPLEALCTTAMEVAELPGLWLTEVWDLVAHLSPLLVTDIPALADALGARPLDAGDEAAARNVSVLGGAAAHALWLEEGAHVEPFTVFDTTLGPILLRRGSTVQAFTRVIGPCHVGRDSTVTTDRISGSSIGDVCRVHGELSASIFIGHANKGHDGFVGHSIVGRWVNMGAGTITSNLKNTYGTVALWTPDGIRDTGQQFLGTLFGDHAKTGIGLRLTTGCVLGAGANVMDAMPPKAVAPFAWGTRAPYDAFALDKFLETAGRMMARRHVVLDDRQRTFWRDAHARATAGTTTRT